MPYDDPEDVALADAAFACPPGTPTAELVRWRRRHLAEESALDFTFKAVAALKAARIPVAADLRAAVHAAVVQAAEGRAPVRAVPKRLDCLIIVNPSAARLEVCGCMVGRRAVAVLAAPVSDALRAELGRVPTVALIAVEGRDVEVL